MIGVALMLLALTAAAGWGIYAVPAPVVDRMLEADLRKTAMRMSRQVDDLFNAEDDAIRPPVARIYTVLGLGIVLSLFGLACSAVPGGFLVVVSWMMAENAQDKVDSGYFTQDHKPSVDRMVALTTLSTLFVLGLFFFQGYLHYMGFYEELWRPWILSGTQYLTGA